MSLKTRAQQHRQQVQQRQTSGEAETLTPGAPTQLFAWPRWGIVDNEICEILGVGDMPGNSPGFLCTEVATGDTAMVPISEVRSFPDYRTALQALGSLTTAGR
jgi:hypothetical protein